MMNFWDQDYFRVSKILSCLVGQWPNQTVKELILSRSVLLTLTIIQVIPRVRAIILRIDDRDFVLEAVGYFMMDIILLIKTINNWYNFKEMKILLDDVEENWKIFSADELQILHQYTASGRRLSIIYLGSIFGGAAVFFTEPLQLRLLRALRKTNETLLLFSIPVDYGSIDVDKYYWGLWILSGITSYLICIGILSCDLLFFIYSYHVFGMFAALGYAIEHLPIDNSDSSMSHEFIYIKRCIQIHYRATEFAETLGGLYIWSFFGITGLNMLMISITGAQIVINSDATGKIVQYGSLIITQLGHVFVECLLGQRLIDHSLDIQKNTWNAQWYSTSLKSQKLMSILLMRSQLPCQLTAGKFLVMNFETFSMLIRTSLSYITILSATQ